MAYTVNSYKDKYIGVDRPSVYDILQKVGTTEYRQGAIKEYEAVDIAEVKIDGNRFRNYGAYSFIWEKTFVKSPERSADGSIGNLNSYATFLTPHLILDFSVMSIDDYRQIMRLHYDANEYTVECYDPIYNRKIKVKMYFATEEMAKLYTIAQNRLLPNGQWEEWVDLVGVTEYKVELIGTNNDLDLVSVTYHLNPPASTGQGDRTEAEYDVYKGEELVIGGASTFQDVTFDGAYKFKTWSIYTEGQSQGNYVDGYAYTINSDLVLYAQWEAMNDHTLNFNYGVAYEEAEKDEETYPTSRKVVKGKSIGVLPQVPTVSVKDPESTIYYVQPYYDGGWYRSPIKAENSVKVSDNEIYTKDRDTTLYLLYDVHTYDLVLKIERDEPYYYENFYIYQANAHQYGNPIKYGSPITLPNPEREGYTFDGWYKSDDFREETKFSYTEMPPRNYTLYGRWIAK